MPLVGGGGAKVQIDFESRVDKLIADSKLVIQQQEAIKRTTKETNQEVKKAAEEAERANKKQTMSLTDVYSAVRLVQQGFQLLKQGYDFAKEGANIQFTAERFDRLAQSIGTTGDVLLGKMKVATKGTLSDLEAMAAATDILSLGLADTQEQAIRLATVQSGLAMDTNQLVLALTNQTTMRFDQLGVSVKGFEEKVKSLEAAGYSAQDAFTEAFLQQAEEQLLRVGNAADAAAGQFKIFEANTKNATDELKEQAAIAVLPLIVHINELNAALAAENEIMEKTARSVGMTRDEFVLWGNAQDDNFESADRLLNAYQRAEEYGRAWERALGDSIPTIEEVRDVVIDAEQAIKDMTKANQDFLNLSEDLTKSQDDYSEKMSDLTEQHSELLSEKQKLIDQGWSEEGEKISEINDKLDENMEKQAEATDEFELNGRRRILSMLEQQLTMGGLNEAESAYLLDLGLKWGVYTADAVADAKAAQEEVRILTDLFNALPTEKVMTITTVQNYVNSGVPSYVAQNYAPGYASGTNGWETVPQGYNNDTYPIRLSSGEQFAVKPAGSQGGGSQSMGGATININVSGGMSDPEEQAQTISQAVKRVLRQEGVVYAQ